MTTREYLQKSIFELEAIFERSHNNASELERLLNELAFRNTAKARMLTTKVEQALTAVNDCSLVSMPSSTPSELNPNSVFTQSSEVVAHNTPEMTVQLKHKPTPDTDQQIELGSFPSFTPSGKANDAPAILTAWTALEALSPQSYKRPEDMAAGDRSRVALLDRDIPWGPNARSKPKHKLYFEIILGAIALDKATDELVKVFGEDEEQSRPDGKKAAIGSILVDKEGFVLENNGVAVSSFAWALKPALDLKLGSLGAWPKVERHIIECLEQIVSRHNEDGEPLPIDLDTIINAHRWLVSQFDVPEHLVEPPSFVIKVFHYFKNKTPPEPSLLNSFYLEDLDEAVKLLEADNAGIGLQRYMGIGRPSQKIDVLSPVSAVEPFVAPSLIPQARWPSQGGHPLVLLQQAAVNAARVELVDAPGIIGINGPPGTGKTTLLRDIVVGCILDRATAMVAFNKPQDAFSTTGEKQAFGSNAFLHFYRLHESLKGHEIVVASSNNKAVENVSKELPLKEANGRHEQIAYFRSISDLIANPKRTGAFEPEDATLSEPIETWGLIAATLGNSSNRGNFQQNFWWNEDRGFLTYLKAARGMNVMREIKDEQTGAIIDRVMPSVVINEQPSTNKADAAAAWQKARTIFLKLKETIDTEIASIESMRRDIQALKGATIELQKLEQLRPSLNEALEQTYQIAESAHREQEKAKSQVELNKALLDSHLAGRPGFFSRLFGTTAWKSWKSALQNLSETLQQSASQMLIVNDDLELARAKWNNAKSQLQQLEHEISIK
ncbi:MAG: DNA helicase, partial [Proteus mirabilis]